MTKPISSETSSENSAQKDVKSDRKPDDAQPEGDNVVPVTPRQRQRRAENARASTETRQKVGGDGGSPERQAERQGAKLRKRQAETQEPDTPQKQGGGQKGEWQKKQAEAKKGEWQKKQAGAQKGEWQKKQAGAQKGEWQKKQAEAQKGDAQKKPAGGQKAPTPVVSVQPLAQPATMRRRHWGLLLSFLLLVLVPLGAITYYLVALAEDQYASTTGFTVRSEEGGTASETLLGLAQFTGGSTGADSDILFEFIQSQEIVKAVDERVDLRAHYSTYWPTDFVFSIWPDATLEDLVWFWQRVVRISYDQATGLIEVRVLAFDPDTAQEVARDIVEESQKMINALSIQAREDATRYARADLEETIQSLKDSREALTQFRTRTRIVDPEADIQGRMGVMNNLQQSLAEALIEYDLLQDTANSSDPRVKNALRRIEVIRTRIAAERQTFASDSTDLGAVGEDYPSLIAEFESLSVDREFAEESYRAALTALDVARDNAARQSRYLAAYIQPTLAESSEYPRRLILIGLSALFLTMFWAIVALVYYSIRDRG